MKAQNKLRKQILIDQAKYVKDFVLPQLATDEQVEEFYDKSNHNGILQDSIPEFRTCGIKTGLECEQSRHYESDAVAARMDDGSWVGWTYWHGGGKHGDPESIEWMENSYDLTCEERQDLVTVRDFKKA